MKRLIAFDLDGTLAASKQAIDPDMALLLTRLLDRGAVAVISGGDWPQFTAQLVDHLPPEADFSRLWLLPTSGTKLYRFAGEWRCIEAETLSPVERAHVIAAMERVVNGAGLAAEPAWGARIEDRISQITLSALGQQAPAAAKAAWDPDRHRREALRAALAPLLPGFAVRIGGSTSIDVTRAGTDKAWGMRQLAKSAALSLDDMLFVGDALYPGGNDAAVRAAGIACIAVRDIADTRLVLTTLVLSGWA